MPFALDSYSEYAHLIFSLLTNRTTVERHTLAVYTTSQTLGITRGQITPPDIKHHRIPAATMSFTEPNLPQVIAEAETDVAQATHDSR